MNFLVLLLYDDVNKGIAFIRSKINEGNFVCQLDLFWKYFLKTWMRKSRHHLDKTGLYLFTSWNISHLINENGEIAQDEIGVDVMVNRTNNPLERFNRVMNERIPTHPTMQVFVQTIKEISNEYVELMYAKKIKRGRQLKHRPVNLPEIPADFHTFVF